MTIPLYVLEDGAELPEKGTYYVVAGNGIFLRKDTGLIKATVQVSKIPFLRELTMASEVRLPQIPAELLAQTLLFFRRVYTRHKSEAVVLLHYNSTTESYCLVCPKQDVSPSEARYESSERLPEHQLVGTIHSHASMGAFHSGVDDFDERYFDGLHITIGNLNQPYFTISCSSVVNGQRFSLKPEGLAQGLHQAEWKPTTQLTYRRTTIPVLSPAELVPESWLGLSDNSAQVEDFEPSQFYDIALPDGKNYRHVGVPHSWIEQVSARISAPPPIVATENSRSGASRLGRRRFRGEEKR